MERLIYQELLLSIAAAGYPVDAAAIEKARPNCDYPDHHHAQMKMRVRPGTPAGN